MQQNIFMENEKIISFIASTYNRRFSISIFTQKTICNTYMTKQTKIIRFEKLTLLFLSTT